jgi:hypothetical protein
MTRYNRRSMPDNALPPIEPIIDPAGRIAGDLPCVRCGYNLHSLAEAGRCPECGEPVERSTAYHLRPSPEWLKGMAEGINLLTTGIAVIAIGWGLLGLGGLVLSGLRGIVSTVPLLVLGFVLVVSVALIKVTAADPSRPVGSRERLSWRRVTRLCLLLSSLSPVLIMMVLAVTRLAWRASLFLVPGVALAPAFFLHMAGLMSRVLRPDLARTARRLALAYAVAGPAFVWWYGAAVYVPGSLLRWPGSVFLSLWGTAIGGILVVSFIFMLRAGRALTAAQYRAERWLSGAAEAASADRGPAPRTAAPDS